MKGHSVSGSIEKLTKGCKDHNTCTNIWNITPNNVNADVNKEVRSTLQVYILSKHRRIPVDF